MVSNHFVISHALVGAPVRSFEPLTTLLGFHAFELAGKNRMADAQAILAMGLGILPEHPTLVAVVGELLLREGNVAAGKTQLERALGREAALDDRLRARVRQRLAQNSEVVGSDEQFFDDDQLAVQLRDLYTEKSGILDFEADTEVDLASYAYQIWANATRDNPALAKKIADLPDVVYSTRQYVGSVQRPQGVLTYMKTSDGTDSLAWLDAEGNSVTQSQYAILRAAECSPDVPAIERYPDHHDLVLQAVELMRRELSIIGIYEIGIDQPHGYWRWSRSRNRRACLRLMASGELRIDHLISHVVPYTEAEAMYATMRNGTEDWLGVVFDWTGFDHQPKA